MAVVLGIVDEAQMGTYMGTGYCSSEVASSSTLQAQGCGKGEDEAWK